jgi:hypothetical protein
VRGGNCPVRAVWFTYLTYAADDPARLRPQYNYVYISIISRFLICYVHILSMCVGGTWQVCRRYVPKYLCINLDCSSCSTASPPSSKVAHDKPPAYACIILVARETRCRGRARFTGRRWPLLHICTYVHACSTRGLPGT